MIMVDTLHLVLLKLENLFTDLLLQLYRRTICCFFNSYSMFLYHKLPSKIHGIFFNGGKCWYMIMYKVVYML